MAEAFAGEEGVTVPVRSVLKCEAPTGVCQACYGRSMASGKPAQIGDAVGKSEVAARQLVSRARRRLGLHGSERFHATEARAGGLAEQFVAACRAGDSKAVERMFTEDVEVHSDGGGKVAAARVVATGAASDHLALCIDLALHVDPADSGSAGAVRR